MFKKRKKDNPSVPWLQAVTNFRVSVFINVVLGVVILGQGIALSTLWPLKTIEPIYVEFQHSTNSFVVVQRAGRNVRANTQLISMFLRSYVSSRETVDKITENDRYRFVVALSGPETARVFKELYGDKDRGLYYQEGKKRYVHIISDNDLGANIHQIMMETSDIDERIDKDNDGHPDVMKTEWIITLKYGFYDQYVNLDPRKEGASLLNPMGIQIEEYSIKKLQK